MTLLQLFLCHLSCTTEVGLCLEKILSFLKMCLPGPPLITRCNVQKGGRTFAALR